MNQKEKEIAENYKCYTWLQCLFPECSELLLEDDMMSEMESKKIERGNKNV